MPRHVGHSSLYHSITTMAYKRYRPLHILYGAVCFFVLYYCLRYLASSTSSPPKLEQYVQEHVDYLDSSQLFHNDKLDALLSQDATPAFTNTQRYGHSYEQLAQLSSQQQQQTVNIDTITVTALVHATPTPSFYAQLASILRQSFRPTTVWLVCSPDDETMLFQHTQALPEKDIIHIITTIASTEDNPSSWMAMALQTDTDYVWILSERNENEKDEGTQPGQHYLRRLVALSATNAYQYSFLGTEASSQHTCLSTSDPSFVSTPAHSIHRLWLFHRSWLSPQLFQHIKESHTNTGLLFSSYLESIGITPVALPLSTSDASTWHHSALTPSSSSCLSATDHKQQQQPQRPEGETLVFLVDQLEQLQELLPLICQSQTTKNKYPKSLHIISARTTLSPFTIQQQLSQYDVTCGLRAAYANIKTMKDDAITIHASTDWLQGTHPTWHMAQHLLHRLPPFLSSLQASVVIHTLSSEDPIANSLAILSSEQPYTVIGLPARDIQHVLWIMDLPVKALENWHSFQVQLVVTTDRNPYGLTRLLRSLNKAHYAGDQVDLTVIMDQTSDRVTQRFVNEFSWTAHGEKEIRHRIVKVNRMPLFVESWYPRNSAHDYAVLLHDDLEVSDFYYLWIKHMLLRYRYNPASASSTSSLLSESVMGISLYTPTMVDAYIDGRRLFTPPSDTTHPYLMQAVTNGGTLFFPEHWREFHDYVTARYADIKKKQLQNIQVPDARSANWTNSWRRYMDELMYLRGYVLLYPFSQQSFSTYYLDLNHPNTTHAAATPASATATATIKGKEEDLMVQQQQNYTMDDATRSLFQVPLVTNDNANKLLSLSQGDKQEQHGDYYDLSALTLFDLWGQVLDSHTVLLERGWMLQRSVSACPPPSVLLYDPADLLCPFARIVDVPVEQATTDVLPTRVATLYLTQPTLSSV